MYGTRRGGGRADAGSSARGAGPIGTAVAATPFDGAFQAQKGKVQTGYELSFQVSGGGRKVAQLRARGLETCEGADSSTLTTLTSSSTWTVRSGKFAARKKEVRGSTTLYLKTARGSVAVLTAR